MEAIVIELMRMAGANIVYNGESLSVTLQSRTGGFTYTDPDSGSSDDCSLSVHDPHDRWISNMFPKKKDKISAQIFVSNWNHQGDNRILNCGTFVIDDPGFSGPPTQVALRAVSQPADASFTTQERTQTWENVTVSDMATEIGGRYGLSLQYEAEPIQIESLEQSGVVDSEFLKKTCESYGLGLKIYSNKLVIFDKELYKQKPSVATILKSKMVSYDFRTTLAGTYTGGKMKYKNPANGEDVEATVGTSERLLTVNGKADNQSDAEKKIKAAVNKANEDETTLNIVIPGNPDLCSTQCVDITGLGVADGKYYIKEAVHTLGRKYETSLTLSKVQNSI